MVFNVLGTVNKIVVVDVPHVTVCELAKKYMCIFWKNCTCSIFIAGTHGLTVYALHPGAIKSDIWRHWKLIRMPLVKQLWQFLTFLFFKDCKQGAQTTIYCSVAEELAGVSGLYYSDCKATECSKVAKDPGLAKKLWETSERITGESWKQ